MVAAMVVGQRVVLVVSMAATVLAVAGAKATEAEEAVKVVWVHKVAWV